MRKLFTHRGEVSFSSGAIQKCLAVISKKQLNIFPFMIDMIESKICP